jgi:hypothetical protein
MDTTLLILTLLVIKHFIVDFPLQVKYQYSNKGTYGHKGGLLHAGLHGIGTLLCFFPFSHFALWFAITDAVIHYHIDWAKMNVNTKMGFKPDTHEQFWWILGVDQLLHYLTYIGLLTWHLATIS